MLLEKRSILAPVAHMGNPSYSGGRDQRITVQIQPKQIVPQDPI
jgi:hypothetical protein